MSLVSSALFSILVNGVPFGIINLSRGIIHGDPLSPFLFILMEEGLRRSIADLRDNNDLRGISVHLVQPNKHTDSLWMTHVHGIPIGPRI